MPPRNITVDSNETVQSLLWNSSRTLTLKFDDTGRITELSSFSYGHYIGVRRALEKSGHLNRFFDLPGNLSSLQRLFLRNREMALAFEDGLDDFYTLLPVIVLHSIREGSGRFFGIITLSDLLPNHFDENEKSVLIYLDTANRLMGYTQGFHHPFRAQFPGPPDLLGLSVDRFLEPLPSQIQDAHALKIKSPKEAQWIERAQFNAGTQALPAPLVKTGEGLEWKAGSEPFSTLPFPGPIDTKKADIRIVFDLRSGENLPGLFLGNREPTDAIYDREGYAITHVPGRNRILIKKCGFNLKEAPLEEGIAGTWEFLKTGPLLKVLRNGREQIRYLDLYPLERALFDPMLFLRGGEASGLGSVRFETRPASIVPPQEEIVITLKDREQSQFLLDRVTEFALAGAHSDLSAYRLRNITAFRERILKLESQLLRQQEEGRRLKGLLASPDSPQVPLIGRSRLIQLLREKAERVAASQAGVLIQGPTGTGKEVLARHLHRSSPRRDSPFVKVDCSTLPATLLESELFGHEKGAFTGADSARPGLFERADKGTLFIDEINNLPLTAQTKLLQFLQDHALVRIGGRSPLTLDVRVLVASGMPLLDLVRQGAFREDLYFRIAVVTFEMPPLRDRLEDLPALCEYFLSLFGSAGGRNVDRISADAYQKMYAHGWPGNVRELRNVIEQAVLFCEGNEITAPLIRFPESQPGVPGPDRARKPHGAVRADRGELEALLRKHGGSVRMAANELGVTARALYFCLERDHLVPDQFRKRPRRRKMKEGEAP